MGQRLELITGKVGHTLWQLQTLEGVLATFFVLVVQAEQGMGSADAETKLNSALGGTFGSTIRKLIEAQKMPEAFKSRFGHLRDERNWLVHHSRSDSYVAVGSDRGCSDLIDRLDAIANEATLLLNAVSNEAETFVQRHCVSTEGIDELVKKTLDNWYGENEL